MTKPKSKPDPVPKLFSYGAQEAIKIATSNLFIDKDTQDIDYMTGLIFEDIGGMELSNLVRYDEINTTETAYGVVSNTNKVANQLKLDFNLAPSNDNSIDLNDYVNKNNVNLDVIAVSQYSWGPGATSGYRTYYVNQDLSDYSVSSNFKVTTSNIGTVSGTQFDATDTQLIEVGNGYFKTYGGYSAVSKTKVSGKAQFSDYVPVYYDSSLYNNLIFNENYSNITIEIYNNYDEYEVEVEFLQYSNREDAET
jgi:hypothetical protein